MITTGSKLLIGSAVAAAVLAIVYGITQEGTLGVIGLVSAAVALAFLAGINLFVRDSNISAMDVDAHTSAPAARPAPGTSMWPAVAGLGATMVAVGLVTFPAITIFGFVVVLAAAAEWLVQAWSERASGDPAFNDEVRERLAHPLEMPVLGAIAVGVVIFSFSRVMLGLPTKTSTVVAFAVIAAIVLAIGAIFASRRRVSTGVVGGVAAVATVALVAGGVAYGVSGERETHHVLTTGQLAAQGQCGVEPTPADENASQTVAAKANVAATVTLGDDGVLSVDQPGYDAGRDSLTLPRSNPNNVLFRNESSEPRRLVIDLGPDPAVAEGDAAAETDGEAADEHSEESGEPAGGRTLCTALVEEGGVQLLTIEFDKPSFAVEGGMHFTVPGVETASLEVSVP